MDNYDFEQQNKKIFRGMLIIAIVLATTLLIVSFSRNLANAIKDNQEGGVSLPTAETLIETSTTKTTEETTTENKTKQTTQQQTTTAKPTTTKPETTTQPTTQPATTQPTTTAEPTTEPTTTEAVVTVQYTTVPVPANTPALYRKLNTKGGIAYGPSGKETFYNMPMGGVLRIMEAYGYSKDDHWIREDGVHMLGDYIMVAADLSKHPRGSLLPTTLGTGIVCDTGTFVSDGSGTCVDVAVTWVV